MRILSAVAVLTVAALPLAAQQPNTQKKPAAAAAAADHDHAMAAPDKAVTGGGTLPAGWSARTDKDAPMANVKFAPMGSGFHVTLGPATVLYRAADQANGPFHTLATFTQTKAPMHPEAYGLFIGGQNLSAPTQQYTYFLVRGDGKYLIKRRDGANTSVIKDWTDSPAVVKADSAGKATNMLEIDNKSDPSTVTFKVNGQAVHSMPADATTKGIVGLRVNHNLDVHVSGFALHQ
jgi:hypothetical protein